MSKLIELNDVHFAYEHKEILCSVNLEINRQDFFILTGDNGTGKSTLVKIILGILKAQLGDVCIHTNKVGYISQKGLGSLKDFPAGVYEVLAMKIPSTNFFNLKSITVKDKVIEAARLVDIESILYKRISDLSGGQLQRVLIARELVNDIDLLILDEPTNGLDKKSIDNLMHLLNTLNKKGLTIGMVSHHIEDIQKEDIKVYRLAHTHIKEVEHEYI